MIIFKSICFELFQLLITERATMMPIYCLFNACLTKYMTTSCDICIIYWIKTYCALELCL